MGDTDEDPDADADANGDVDVAAQPKPGASADSDVDADAENASPPRTKRAARKKKPTLSLDTVAELGGGNVKLAVRGFVMDVVGLVENVLPDGSQYRGAHIFV